MLPPKLPSDVSQSRILKALRKSGFILIKKGELKEILKQAEEYGYDATAIMDKY
ncbi:MAG: hypothetical protein HYV13_00670 [Candidatus Doudnabacteria bacterium]|nr:hypothetical protein [Candidatus Doudnabacteria bacterium]